MLIEIKSSMSRSEVYTFERIVEFYEAEENRIVDRKLIICPYFKPGVIDVAENSVLRFLPMLPMYHNVAKRHRMS